MSPVELRVLELLKAGPITGTSEVGHALWPNRLMKPQGAALAVGSILRRLWTRTWVVPDEGERTTWSITPAGLKAIEEEYRSRIDPRQLSLI